MESIHIFDEFIDKDLNGSDPQILHQKRTKLEPFIYDILKIKYYNIFDTFWKKNTVQKDTNKSIVIIERRIHPNLSFLIRNMFYYARDWSITIICSDINFSYLKTILTNNNNYYFIDSFILIIKNKLKILILIYNLNFEKNKKKKTSKCSRCND